MLSTIINCLFIDNNTHRYIVVYGTKAQAFTGVGDAIKYKRKYKFQIAIFKIVCEFKNIQLLSPLTTNSNFFT